MHDTKSRLWHIILNELAPVIRDSSSILGWSGGAMVLGKLPVLRRPAFWIIVGQGPIALAVGAGGGLFRHFFLSSTLSNLFLPLSGRRPDID